MARVREAPTVENRVLPLSQSSTLCHIDDYRIALAVHLRRFFIVLEVYSPVSWS
jgi:hypothetical protein